MFQRQPWMQRVGEHPRTDREYFALLARSVFSAGLGPRVVESRWEGLRAAFHDFDPAAVAAMSEDDVQRLLSSPEVIRNRRKIQAVITDAQVFCDEATRCGGFHRYLEASGVRDDFAGAADLLSARFSHLGRTSASLFLFSAGWREPQPESPESSEAAAPGATTSADRAGGDKAAARAEGRAGRRRAAVSAAGAVAPVMPAAAPIAAAAG
jgi:Methyladenine glycosylase